MRSMTRRVFVNWVSAGARASPVGFLLAACQTPAPPAIVSPTQPPPPALPTQAPAPAAPTQAPAAAKPTQPLAASGPTQAPAAQAAPKRGGTFVLAQASD